MAKVLILGDIHLSDRPPSSCTETYTDDLFDLLYQTVILSRKGYDAVVQAGDLFHSKIPGRTSHKLVQRTVDWIQDFEVPFFVVPGNHDMANDRLDSIFTSQPLGVVLRAGAHQLRGFTDPSLPVYGVPWLAEWNDRNPEGKGPAYHTLRKVETALEQWHERFDGSVPCLLVTHAPFYPPGSELTYEFFPTELFARHMGEHGSVYYGHIHEPHGEYVVEGVRFCNNGAVSRGSLHEYNLTREVAVTSWDSVTGEFTRISLEHKPASEVFRLQEASEAKALQVSLDQFLASIGETSIEITSIESVLAYIRQLDLGSEIELVIEDLLQGVDHATAR